MKLFVKHEDLVICDPLEVLTKDDRENKKYQDALNENDLNYMFKHIGLKRYVVGYLYDKNFLYWNVRGVGGKLIGEFQTESLFAAALPLRDVRLYNNSFYPATLIDTIIFDFTGEVFLRGMRVGEYRNFENRIIGTGNKPFHTELQYRDGVIVTHTMWLKRMGGIIYV